jgi:hypothetical protein
MILILQVQYMSSHFTTKSRLVKNNLVYLERSDIPPSICPRLAQGIPASLYQVRRLQHLLTLIESIDRRADYHSPASVVRNHQDDGTSIYVHGCSAREQCLHRRGRHHRHGVFHLFGKHTRLGRSQK